MGLWVWRNFRIEVPDDWEILQFMRDPDDGRCVWADRYQVRLEMSWRRLGGAPDMQRSLADYISKVKQDGVIADAAEQREGPWYGLVGHMGPLLNSRFMRYFRRESCMLQLVFLWPDGRDAQRERQVLRSVDDVPPRKGNTRRWRTFGLDLHADGALTLKRCAVEPGNASLTFGDAGAGPGEEQFRRMGFVKYWLNGSVRDWLCMQRPPRVKIHAQDTSEVAGHRVERIEGTRPASGLKRLLGKRQRFEAAAWVCPADGRLYSVSRLRNGGQNGRLKLVGEKLSCCGKLH
jgi:hypothetical protein